MFVVTVVFVVKISWSGVKIMMFTFLLGVRKTTDWHRRVVGKAEHLAKGSNPIFVVTSLPAELYDAHDLYEKMYCARGDMENRIKEQQLMLFAARTSTKKMHSNQVRLYFSSLAYVVMQALRRLGLVGTVIAKAQCDTIRLRLFKIGARGRLDSEKGMDSICRRVSI